MWRNFRRTCLVVSMLTAFSGMAYGQSFTGVISGRIEDATAAAVPGAKIAAIEKETNVMTRTVSDGQGEYSLPQLPSGSPPARSRSRAGDADASFSRGAGLPARR